MQHLRLLRHLICVYLFLTFNHPIFSCSLLTNNDDPVKIVIDAGHGGKDIGTHGSRLVEKNITLQLAFELGDQIKASLPTCEIIYTRKDDVFLPVHQRVLLANELKADLFVSVHCNSVTSTDPNGMETYVLGLHQNKEQLDIAKRENASILHERDYLDNYDGFDPNSPAGHIFLSAVRNAHMQESIQAAHSIQSQFNNQTVLRNRGVRQAGFIVLRKAMMPAVLLEVGFLTNSSDEQKLYSKEERIKMIDKISQGISNYITEKVISRRSNHKLEIASEKKLPVLTQSEELLPPPIESIYQVLIASSTNGPLELSSFHIPDEVQLFTESDNQIHRYFVGNYYSLVDAVEMQNQMRQNGFKGAYVVESVSKDVQNVSLAP